MTEDNVPRITAEHIRMAERSLYVREGLRRATTKELLRELLGRMMGSKRNG